MLDLILLRHAQSTGNKAGLFQGQADMDPIEAEFPDALLRQITAIGEVSALYTTDLKRGRIPAESLRYKLEILYERLFNTLHNAENDNIKPIINGLKKHNIKSETRNLGKKQMPTDTAVYVAKRILGGKKLSDFKFVDELKIEVNDNESVTLPFRYVVDGKKLIINEKLVEYLRKRKEF